MAKIIISMDGLVLQEVPLVKERTAIGRRPHNDVVIDNLAISGEHAVIVTILNDSFLEDMNSTNGTFVNGQPVKKHFLQNNDVIEMAKYRIKFLTEAMAGTSGLDAKLAVAMPSAASAQAAASAPLDSRPGSLKVLNGASAGKQLGLTKPVTTLGKPGVQVAVITRRPEGYVITHVEGATHPLINGGSIGVAARLLAHGDVIALSGTQMEFSLA